MNILLTRDQFKQQVFKRDDSKCVFCEQPAVDAHHIIDRSLFPDGGYYVNNGASVCEHHHMECELTNISVKQVRQACGITEPVIPPHFYQDEEYDKWGNIVLPNGQRLKGELFNNENVQKVLRQANVLSLFTKYVKYPRTYHFPWSPNLQNDDRMLTTLEHLEGQYVIATEKMDGENTTLYNDYIHARSINSGSHVTREWVKNFWGSIRYEIPDEWRICGENTFAEHSISYTNLPSYFLGFSIWNEKNECLSWNETVEWFELLGIVPVPVFYQGIFDKEKIHQLFLNSNNGWDNKEGYVVRVADKINMSEFQYKVGKYVRKGHVQTNQFWMRQQVKPNKLK